MSFINTLVNIRLFTDVDAIAEKVINELNLLTDEDPQMPSNRHQNDDNGEYNMKHKLKTNFKPLRNVFFFNVLLLKFTLEKIIIYTGIKRYDLIITTMYLYVLYPSDG